MTFSLSMHPASEGDALELKWGDGRRALIDLGRKGDYRELVANGIASGDVDLFVMTHVDADHIEGAVPMAASVAAPFNPKEAWFNGYHHLRNAKHRMNGENDREELSVEQGEALSDGINRFDWNWNTSFASGIASTDSAEASRLEIAGLKIRLLSPTDLKLSKLESKWRDYLEEAGLLRAQPGEGRPSVIEDDREHLGTVTVEELAQFNEEDTAPPNGTSIAFIAEFEGRTILLGADAHPGVLVKSLEALGYSETNRLKLDLYKVSHHGSKFNTSSKLLKLLDCTRFAFSTDGTRNDHPHPEAIAKILVNDPLRPKTLYFNFRQEHSLRWDDASLKTKWLYHCSFPPDGAAGLTVVIAP